MARPNTSLSYSACHAFLSRHYPKTGRCDECGSPAKTHYALIKDRAYSKDRQDYRELCPRCHARYDQGGAQNSQAKLTPAQVSEIRLRYQPGRPGPGLKDGSLRHLAGEYNVSHTVIKEVVQGSCYADHR